MKGAYNGVNKQVLLHRLRTRRIPEKLVKWVDGFCSERNATVVVNGQESHPAVVADIEVQDQALATLEV